MAAREVVPGKVVDPENLVAAYERIGRTALADLPDEKDPVKEAHAAADPWAPAKEVAERAVKFLVLASSEWRLSPAQLIFAQELAALNVLNAEDCPLSPTEISAAREAAFQYYAANRDRVPSAPKKAR